MPTASVSRVIHASLRDVWALISDIRQARRWNKYWTEIEFLSTQTHGVGARFAATTEGGESFVFDVCDWDAPQRIAFCPIRDPDERYSITLDSHVFQVRHVTEDACELEITAEASARGFRGHIISLFFWRGHQKEGLNAALDSIQAVFEPGLFADESPAEKREAVKD